MEAVSWCNSSQPNHTIFIKEFDDKWLIKILQINCLSQEQRQAIEQMKFEIASEFGVNLGADTTSRANGSVGGEITKRLVSQAQASMGGQQF